LIRKIRLTNDTIVYATNRFPVYYEEPNPSTNGFLTEYTIDTTLSTTIRSTPSSTFPITFVIKQKDFNSNVIIQTDAGNNITLTNETTVVKSNGFLVFYEEPNPSTNGFLIEYTIDKTKYSSSTTATPSISPNITTKTTTTTTTTPLPMIVNKCIGRIQNASLLFSLLLLPFTISI
jgi:hypothetical protein